MKKLKVQERISFETKDGFGVDVRPWQGSDPKRLQAWRDVLSKPAFKKCLEKIAKKIRQARLLDREIFTLAKDLDVETSFFASTGLYPSDLTDGKGKSWYEIPVDGSGETAREAYARFCEQAYSCYPEKDAIC